LSNYSLPAILRVMPCALLLDWSSVNWSAVEAVATIGAVVVALLLGFLPALTAWWRRPVLRLELRNEAPDSHMTRITSMLGPLEMNRSLCYYLRLRISNIGGAAAENVEVLIDRMDRLGPDGDFSVWNEFLPMNLQWSHNPGMTYLPRITPGLFRNCDFGRIVDPRNRVVHGDSHDLVRVPAGQTVLALDLIVRPDTGTFLLPPGTYRVHLAAAAANALVARRRFHVRVSGTWSGDEQTMRNEGIEVAPD
jgi:hypothetical protein